MSPRFKAGSKWLLFATVCGLAAATAVPAQAQTRPVGIVVGMQAKDYAGFLGANIIRQRNVNFLHVSQVIAGQGNSAVLTAGVNQANNTQPADTVYFPAPNGAVAPAFTQINSNDQYLQQQVIGAGNTAIAQVDVNQQNSGTYTPGQTRWMWVPQDRLGELAAVNSQVNLNNTHLEQVAIGSNNNLIAVVNTNQGNNLAIPGSPQQAGSLANVMVNVNTNVIVQTVIGEGNTAVAQVNVNQQNG